MHKPVATLNVTIAPESFIRIVDALDEAGAAYRFVRTGAHVNGIVELRISVDDSPTGHAIILNPDGTWIARSEVVIAE